MISRRTGVAVVLPLIVVLAAVDAGPRSPLGPSAAAGEDPTPRYFVCPVKTDLQERLVPPKTDVCVVVDASAALRDKELTPAGLSLDWLRTDLRKLKTDRTTLHFHLFCGAVPADRDAASRMAHYAVIGFAHELGFPKVTASGIRMANGNDRTWEAQAEPLLKKDRPADGPEPASGDADVRVYPVRTALSRYLTSGADCLVVFEQPLDSEHGRLPNKYRAVAAQAVAELKLPERKQIAFHIQRGKLTDAEAAQLLNAVDHFGQELGSIGGYINQR